MTISLISIVALTIATTILNIYPAENNDTRSMSNQNY